MDKDVYVYNGIILSKKKENIFFPLATTWKDLEDVMLSEITQTENDKYCMNSLTCEI